MACSSACTIPIVSGILAHRLGVLAKKGLSLAQASLLTRTCSRPPPFTFASSAQKVMNFTTKPLSLRSSLRSLNFNLKTISSE